jgi:hypothetical protein
MAAGPFADMVAQAISPTMTREEREVVYRAVKEAVLRLHEGDGRAPTDPEAVLRQHLVEETVRDVEAEVVRYLVLEGTRAAVADEG